MLASGRAVHNPSPTWKVFLLLRFPGAHLVPGRFFDGWGYYEKLLKRSEKYKGFPHMVYILQNLRSILYTS
jgi:hypothetical protein